MNRRASKRHHRDIAGILIERVTGAPFAEVLSKRVFEPLGMADTAFSPKAGPLAGRLEGLADLGDRGARVEQAGGAAAG